MLNVVTKTQTISEQFFFKKYWNPWQKRARCVKATERLRRDSLLFTTQFPGVPGTHLIDLERMKSWVQLGATQRF